MGEPPLVYLVAGEPSGDLLGGRLIAALRQRCGDRIAVAGIGGPRMAAEGLDSLFPMDELAVMGLVELLPHLPRIARRLREAEADIARRRPAVLVTIDSPGFTLRLARRVQSRFGRAVTRVHYVAPTVWAWKPGRARVFAGIFDHLMVLLPFEPPYFTVEGLATTFVGHPAAELPPAADAGAGFRASLGLALDRPVLGLLPGSRRGEFNRLWPVFAAAARSLLARHPGLQILVPTVESLAVDVADAMAAEGLPGVSGVFADRRAAAFAACDVAIAASGTVSVELAAAGVPMVVAYRMQPLTYRIVRRLVKVEFASLINILLGYAALPECLQRDCTPERIAAAAEPLLSDPTAAALQRAAATQALERLGRSGTAASLRAADVLLSMPALSAAARASPSGSGRPTA